MLRFVARERFTPAMLVLVATLAPNPPEKPA
jgi:hypothetical protein